MEYHYSIREDVTEDEEGQLHTVYGIDVISDSGACIKSVPDLFCEKEKATALIDTCNKLQLHIVHLMDVILDSIDS